MASSLETYAGQYIAHKLDEAGTPAYYGFMTSNSKWMVMQVTSTAIQYASQKNNSSYSALSTAWTNRVTLVYADAPGVI